MNENLKLLTIDELAQLLKVQTSWIYRRTMETGPGAIPRIKMGRYLRFEWEAVEAWLRSLNKAA